MNVQHKKIPTGEVQPEERSFIEECSLDELRERIRIEFLAHLALIGLEPLAGVSDYPKRSAHSPV